jgi:hypothetical protein
MQVDGSEMSFPACWQMSPDKADAAVLASHLHQMEDTAVPEHLRVSMPLPAGVTRLCGRRARS